MASSQAEPASWWRDYVLWLLTAVAAILLLWNLGGRCLWQDEAETALLARNILSYGKPVARDGINIVSQEVGREFEADGVWRWSPWMQFYLAAGGLKFFGDSTQSARLPFALLAILVVPLTYLLARRVYESILIARFAALALATSVWFFLHARQARWEAPAYVLACLILLAVFQCRRSMAWTVVLVFAAAALFYTNYFVAICFLFAIAVASPLLGFNPPLLAGLSGAALLSGPGVVYFHVLEKVGGAHVRAWIPLWIYVAEFFTFVAPLALVAIAAADKRPATRFLLAVTVGTCGMLAVAPWIMFRYLTILFPIAALLLGVALSRLMQKNVILGWSTAALLVFTSVLHRLPLGYLGAKAARPFDQPISPVMALVGEIVRPPQDPESVVADFLRAHAESTDTVLATYGDLVLQYYTRMHIVGGLAGQPLPVDPDWIIRRSFTLTSEPGKDDRVHRFIDTQVDGARYELAATVPDPSIIGNPDPKFHSFRAIPDAAPLQILRRIR